MHIWARFKPPDLFMCFVCWVAQEFPDLLFMLLLITVKLYTIIDTLDFLDVDTTIAINI